MRSRPASPSASLRCGPGGILRAAAITSVARASQCCPWADGPVLRSGGALMMVSTRGRNAMHTVRRIKTAASTDDSLVNTDQPDESRRVDLKRRIQISDSDRICVRILAARCARGLHQIHPLRKQRAQGKPGADCTRGRAHKAHEWTTGSTGSSRLSPRNGLRLIRDLPGDRAFLPPSLRGLTIYRKPGWAGHISAKLDASVGAPEQHDFTVRARLAKALAGPRTIRPVSSKTVLSAVRPHAG